MDLRPASDKGDIPSAIAAIDIGTNSIHMVIARVAANGRFEVVTREKDMVRLGSGTGEMKCLSDEAIERGVTALKRCRILADSFGATIRAVATSAMREARNADDLIRRAAEEAGIDIDVIPGNEEARLIYLGVLQALPVFDDDIVLVDVGGGSTEILFGSGGDVEYARSVKLGALRITNKFFPDGMVLNKSVTKCRKYVRSKIAPVEHETASLPRTTGVVSSGTAETLATMALVRRAASPIAGDEEPEGRDRSSAAPVASPAQTASARLNASVISVAELSAIIEELAAVVDTESRRRIEGLDPARADIILGGAIVLEQVCIALGLSQVTVSGFALREGVLLDTLQRLGAVPSARLANLRRSSVFHLMELCDDDPDHSVQVARLATAIHDALEGPMGLGGDSRELLEAAALLANVGMFIAHSAHHKHSYYVIRNSDHLMGFTTREIEVVAQVARYHRKSAPSENHPEFAALSESDRKLVRSLAAILRVAIGMDRNHDGRIASIRTTVIDDRSDPKRSKAAKSKVVISLVPRDDRDLDLELFATADRSRSLANVLGLEVEVVASDPDQRRP